MAKPVLSDCVYLVEKNGSGHLVYKMIQGMSSRPDPYVVAEDGICSCKAGDVGRECKHSKMAERSLIGHDVSWKKAKQAARRYLRLIEDECPDARILSLLDLKEKTETVQVAHALVTGADLISGDRERLTIWTEFQGLLLVVHVFKSEDRFERAALAARRKARRQKRGNS